MGTASQSDVDNRVDNGGPEDLKKRLNDLLEDYGIESTLFMLAEITEKAATGIDRNLAKKPSRMSPSAEAVFRLQSEKCKMGAAVLKGLSQTISVET